MNHVGGTQPFPLAAVGQAIKKDEPAKIRAAAQQFEALLIGQILRSVRESGGGWLGSGGDGSGDCATEYAEQHFAAVLAQQGGLGLADMISRGLERASEDSTSRVTAVLNKPQE